MSFPQVTTHFYEMFVPDEPWHQGSEGWSTSPWPGWGNNPNLVGLPRLAVDGLGAAMYQASKAVADPFAVCMANCEIANPHKSEAELAKTCVPPCLRRFRGRPLRGFGADAPASPPPATPPAVTPPPAKLGAGTLLLMALAGVGAYYGARACFGQKSFMENRSRRR